jgi:hypothetical protein
MWLYVPSQSVPEERPASSSDFTSLADELSRSVTWRGKLRQSRLWLRAWKKGLSPLRQCGAISELSMEENFAAWLTQFQRDCPASPIPLPENEKDTPTNAPSGPSSYEWWERCSRAWYSSKMYLSFLNTFESSEKNYRDWATWLRNRYSSQPAMLAPHTGDYESSYWPTSNTHDSTGKRSEAATVADHHYFTHDLVSRAEQWPTPDANMERGDRSKHLEADSKAGRDLKTSAGNWPTPSAEEGGYNQSDSPNAKQRPLLNSAAKNWPTPRAEDGESCGNHPNSESDSLTGVTKAWNTPKTARGNYTRDHGDPEMERPSLQGQAEMWATPKVVQGGPETGQRKKELGRDESGGGDLQAQVLQMWQIPAADSFRSRLGDRVDEMGLDQQARFWPSPQSRDFRSGETQSDYGNSRPLNEAVLDSPSLPDPSTQNSGNESLNSLPILRRRLNPAFVAWLMGLPWWWTNPGPISSARLETEWYLSRQRRLLRFLLGERDSGSKD